MTRINAFRSMKDTNSLAWGKNTGALIFAAVLIICSVTVGCSSSNDKPKPVNANHQIPATQPQTPAMPAPVVQAETKPAPVKKVVSRRPTTVNYTDKTYGVTFEYPRRYAIETGEAATSLLMSNPIPMNFVQPGGVALAAVELPETNYANTDFSSAFFNVSVNKTLTAEQCGEFAIPQPKAVAKSEATPATSNDTTKEVAKEVVKEVAKQDSTAKSDSPMASTSVDSKNSDAKTEEPKPTTEVASNPDLILKDMQLPATEAVSGEGTRQSDSKYFHVYQNGSCYEFALNVTTNASEEGLVKHVDREKVFSRLEQILSTVKISPVAPEVTADAPAPAPAAGTPAQ